MTDQSIRDMVSEFAALRKRAMEEARFARNYCPDHCILSVLFGPVVWDMGMDMEYQAARLELLARGYRA